MIDQMDKQTQPVALEEKRGRGRPATGKAMSNAERQRRYREAQKAQRNEMERELHNAEATLRVDEYQNDELWQELEQAKARIAELEAQLTQRNDNNEESAEYWKRMHSQCVTELAFTREALDEICGRLMAAESRLAELSGKNSEVPRYWCMRTRKQGSTKWKKLNAPWYNIEHAKEAVRQLNANSDGWEWELYTVRNDA